MNVFFRKDPSSVTPSQVLKALSTIIDPDLGRDIVTLGFVKNIRIDGGKVAFDVELTTPACPVKEELKAQCEANVRGLAGVTSVEVQMTAQVRAAETSPGRLALPGVRHVIAVASGKGGVGKSTVTVNLAYSLAKQGARVGILDADIYGPSVPMMVGTQDERPLTDGQKVFPVEKDGVRFISMGYFVPPEQAVVWRGPMVHGALTQFLTQTDWGELDYLFIDMPPGTGDAQLTISQNAPLSGAVVVTTPQDVSLLDARRGVKMFESVQVPVLGIIENMSGFICSHCNERTEIFRVGGGEKLAKEIGVRFLGAVPIDPKIAPSGDEGKPLSLHSPESPASLEFAKIASTLAAQLAVRNFRQADTFKPVDMEWK